MKPFLRWAGSKAQLLPTLRSYWNERFNRYVEPFCGSAALFFSIRPPVALLSDLNSDLICTLSQVQLGADKVYEVLKRFPSDKANYYKLRATDPATLSPNERAARFIYLNALCFNGLYRTNTRGQFNVPYGSKTRLEAVDAASLRAAGAMLRSAVLDQCDFEDVVDRTGEGDFLYVDPPYVTSSARVFTAYGKDVFSDHDVSRLTASLTRAAARRVSFVLSYADVPEIREFGARWNLRFVETRRNIAGFAGSRKRVREVLISNLGGH